MKVQLSLTMNNGLFNKIRHIANKMDMDKNELILKAVKKYLLISEIKEIRKKLKPLVKKRGFKNESDIFNAVS